MKSVVVGDRIRISVALIRQIAKESPVHESLAVKLVDVQVEDDGCKVLHLQRDHE